MRTILLSVVNEDLRIKRTMGANLQTNLWQWPMRTVWKEGWSERGFGGEGYEWEEIMWVRCDLVHTSPREVKMARLSRSDMVADIDLAWVYLRNCIFADLFLGLFPYNWESTMGSNKLKIMRNEDTQYPSFLKKCKNNNQKKIWGGSWHTPHPLLNPPLSPLRQREQLEQGFSSWSTRTPPLRGQKFMLSTCHK